MSRIGNKMIPVPSGVKIQVKDGAVEVQGPKGKMNVRVPRESASSRKTARSSPSATPKSTARCTDSRARSSPTR